MGYQTQMRLLPSPLAYRPIMHGAHNTYDQWIVSGHTSNTSGTHMVQELIRFFGAYSTHPPNTHRGQADTHDTHTHKHMLAQVLINERSRGMASAPGAPLDLLHPTHFP